MHQRRHLQKVTTNISSSTSTNKYSSAFHFGHLQFHGNNNQQQNLCRTRTTITTKSFYSHNGNNSSKPFLQRKAKQQTNDKQQQQIRSYSSTQQHHQQQSQQHQQFNTCETTATRTTTRTTTETTTPSTRTRITPNMSSFDQNNTNATENANQQQQQQQQHIQIKQSPNDQRQYAYLQLDNGLSALVISDPKTKESSCSMNVRVGYFNDPVDRAGLAHFCEHMLFLGTVKYPTEGEYKKFLSKHGGASNASTSSEYTSYFFSVNNDGFDEAMDRFAQFFISPLFRTDGTMREVNAVDSEFRRNLQTDSRRNLQLLKCFVNERHPFQKFSTGNLQTLLRVNEGEKCENVNEGESVKGGDTTSVELRERVVSFYEQTYSSDCMKLVCYGAQSIEQLKQMVIQRFSEVTKLENRSKVQNLNEPLFILSSSPSSSLSSSSSSTSSTSVSAASRSSSSSSLLADETTNGEFLGSIDEQQSKEQSTATTTTTTTTTMTTMTPTCNMVHIVPVKDLKQLVLYWEFPSQYPIYRNKVNFYLNYLLEHQGTGSLYQLLKGKGLINSISSGVYMESSSFSLYRVAIDLTNDGLEHIDTILRHFYQYVHLIKQETILKDSARLGHEIFDEVRKLHEQSFVWLEKVSPSTYTSRISKRMQEYPIEDCLYAPYHFGQFDPNLILEHLELLSPSRMHIQIVSKMFEEEAQLQEPIYGTKYFVRPMSEPLFALLMNTDKWSKHLAIPGRNSFIAEDFSIKPEQVQFDEMNKVLMTMDPEEQQDSSVLPDLEPPRCITGEQSKHRVWYKPYSHFSMPLAHAYTMVRMSGDHIQNIRGALLLRMFISMVYESLSDVSYDAEMADLSFEIHSETGEGLEIFCGGFNHKLPELIRMIYERIVNPEFNPIVFDRIKNLYIRKYSNHAKDQANEQGKYLVNMVTQEPFFAYGRSLKIAQKLEMSDVVHFYNQTIRNSPEFRIDTFINGNMTRQQCETIANQMDELLNYSELPQEEEAVSFIFQLPRNVVTLIERPSSNSQMDANCSVNVHFQLGERDLRSKVKLDLLSKIMKSYFFDSLRTKQQCGYSVHTRPIYYQCSLAYQLYVQSPSHHPRDVYARIKRFVTEEFAHILNRELDDESFDKYRDSLIKTKQKPHTKLLEESFNYWTEIYYRRYHWDKLKDEIRELTTVSKRELIEFYEQYFIRSERQELAVLVYGSAFPFVDGRNSPDTTTTTTPSTGRSFLDIIDSVTDAPAGYLHVGSTDMDIEQFKQCHMRTRYPVKRHQIKQ